MTIQIWKVIREHRENDEPLNIGRIVWVNEDLGKYWWIPFSGKNKYNQTRNFIKAIRKDDISKLEARLGKDLSLVDFIEPKIWFITEAEMVAETEEDKLLCLSYRSRRKLQNWKKRRDGIWNEIRSLFENNCLRDIIELDLISNWSVGLTKNSGCSYPDAFKARITRAARMYILSGLNKNALIPDWDGERQRGKTKVSSKPTGRKYVDGTPAYVITDADRHKLKQGWTKYKKPRISVETAFARTNAEYYCLAVQPHKKQNSYLGFQAVVATGLMTKPRSLARRLSAATLR